MSGFSIDDLRFRRRGADECDIVVYGMTVGTVMRRPDITNPDGGRFYVIHLYDDRRGPKQLDDRSAIASMRSSAISSPGRRHRPIPITRPAGSTAPPDLLPPAASGAVLRHASTEVRSHSCAVKPETA